MWREQKERKTHAHTNTPPHTHTHTHTHTLIVGPMAQSKSFGKGCWSGGDYNLWCLRSAADASAERISYPQRESKFSIKGEEGSEEHVTIQGCPRLAGIFLFHTIAAMPSQRAVAKTSKVLCLECLVWKELSPSKNAHVGYRGCQ